MLTSFKSISGYIDIEINDKYLERISLAKNVIYTCNAGSYSPVKHISSLIDLSRKKGHDFFIFTDKKIKNINEYNQILFNFKSPNPRYAAKIFKIRPDLFFTNAEVSLWIDANVQFNKNFFQKIKEFKSSNAEIFLFNHDKRSNIFEEANECKKYLKDDIYIIDNQIENYKKKDKNLENINLSLDVNGNRHQTGNTNQMIFDFNFLVAYISSFITLMPGDIVTTGTPPGVGLGMTPPVFLKNGDKMELSVDNLGTQTIQVITE